MSSLSEISQIGVVGVTEAMLGALAGGVVDAAFPDATPDAPFLVQLAEVAGETAVFAVITATFGRFLTETINPQNVDGGFPFFMGLSAGMGNYRIKLATLIAKLKIRAAESINYAAVMANEMIRVPPEQQGAPSKQME